MTRENFIKFFNQKMKLLNAKTHVEVIDGLEASTVTGLVAVSASTHSVITICLKDGRCCMLPVWTVPDDKNTEQQRTKLEKKLVCWHFHICSAKRTPPPKKRRQSILKNSSWCVSHYWNIFIESLKSPIFPTLFLLLDVQMVAIIHYLPNLIGTSSDAVLGVDKNSSATVTAVARPEACKYFSVNVYFKSH